MARTDRQSKAEREAQLDQLFHALADPARRKILALLREAGELSVGELAEAFAMSLNGVSKHVKVLEGAGVVHRRIEGRVHRLSVRWDALQPGFEFLHAHHHFWSSRLEQLVDYTLSRQATRKEAHHD